MSIKKAHVQIVLMAFWAITGALSFLLTATAYSVSPAIGGLLSVSSIVVVGISLMIMGTAYFTLADHKGNGGRIVEFIASLDSRIAAICGGVFFSFLALCGFIAWAFFNGFAGLWLVNQPTQMLFFASVALFTAIVQFAKSDVFATATLNGTQMKPVEVDVDDIPFIPEEEPVMPEEREERPKASDPVWYMHGHDDIDEVYDFYDEETAPSGLDNENYRTRFTEDENSMCAERVPVAPESHFK